MATIRHVNFGVWSSSQFADLNDLGVHLNGFRQLALYITDSWPFEHPRWRQQVCMYKGVGSKKRVQLADSNGVPWHAL